MYNNLTYLKAHLEINQDEERADDFYALSKDMCIVTKFLQSVETQQRAWCYDDGRRMDTVPTLSKRLSQRVSFLTF